MPDVIVVDCEIANPVEEVGGWESTHLMGVACACVWEQTTDRLRVYGPGNLDALRARILKADRVIGFNTWSFDYPVIWEVGRPDWITPPAAASAWTHWRVWSRLRSTRYDLQRQIFINMGLDPDAYNQRTHGGWSLDSLARGTLNREKTESGKDAPLWHRAGQWARVVDHCAEDVCLTRDLAAFMGQYGYVRNGGSGEVVQLVSF
jgi:DEAD/DEAH box helicase domain-containing protein